MAATITPITAPYNPDVTGREIIAYGTVVLSGSYPVGGDILDLTQLGDLLKTSQLPNEVYVWEDPAAGTSATSPTFAQFVYCPGTTLANGKLAIALLGVQSTAQTYALAFPNGLPTLRVCVWAPAY